MNYQNHQIREKILIVDYGSQVTKLIARRVRELGAFSEIINPLRLERIKDIKIYKGIILSGGPSTVVNSPQKKIPKILINAKIPILGICYGLQLLAITFGGKVITKKTLREFGKAEVKKKNNSLLTRNFFDNNASSVWMSHQDAVSHIPRNFNLVGSTKNSKFTIIENKNKKYYGVQFHPEVTHTKKGKILLKNFIYLICNLKKKWRISSQKNVLINKIKNIVKNENKVICALSGGVDSSVTAILVHKAIKSKLKCIMVDTGLMRKNEFKKSFRLFKKKYKLNVSIIKASSLFLKKLKNVHDPEKKRKIIGQLFIKIFESEAKKIKNVKYLAQGTLYPDIIESKSVTGSITSKIKSHHNVGGLPKKMNLELIEPLKDFFKDEVRKLGKSLGVSDEILNKHPFPGPGLAIRIPGKITKEKIKIVQEADEIFINNLIDKNYYKKIWQAYAALLPVRTVGVMGDSRTFEYICLLRAVISDDGMTADSFFFPKKFLDDISNKIVNNVKGVNRVVYDITTKPPSTIELE